MPGIKTFLVLAFFGSLVYLLWPYNVLDMKDQNPPTTAFMELRKNEAAAAGKKYSIQYIWKDMGDISPALAHAVILSEDDTFYQHSGFDLEQIKIAYQRDMAKKKFVYGGSTISQQLARNLFLRPRKSIFRKIKEAVLTVYLEQTLSKKRILELYLNVVEWGPGIFGAEAAAQHYFSKPASALTPDESVALASILPSPRRWSPFSEKVYMARRRSQLLERMQKAGYAPLPEYAPVADPMETSEPEPAWDPNSLAEPPHLPPADTSTLVH